jgi:N-acetylglucosamine kinase-like BadF-type ATPase
VNVPADIVVDGGGSGTRAGISIDGSIVTRIDGPSANPMSVGDRTAVVNLVRTLNVLWANRPAGIDRVESVCLALSAAPTTRALERFSAAVLSVSSTCPALAGSDCWIANDVAPLVFDSGAEELVVVACGTGTGFAARARDSRYGRASGLEFLLSDEGGGFDIGLRGLRAVVRAADGRGPRTLLTNLAGRLAGGVDELYDLVYSRSDVKVLIASFARDVVDAAGRGDEVGSEIVRYAANELAIGAAAVHRRAELSGSVDVRVSGSLLARGRALRAALDEALGSHLPAPFRLSVLSQDPLELVAAFLSHVRADPVGLKDISAAFPVGRWRMAHR